jgi:hypothetical protein
VLGELQHRPQVTLQDELPVQPERRTQGLGLDVRVPVLVSADPGSELQDASQARRILRVAAGELVLELPVSFEGRGDKWVLEEEEGALYLLGDLGAPRPQLVGLPEHRRLLGQPLLETPALFPTDGGGLQRSQNLCDVGVLAPHAPAHRLCRMGRENEADAQAVEDLLHLPAVQPLALEPRDGAGYRRPLWRVLRTRLVLPPAAYSVVALRNVDELEVNREGTHDLLQNLGLQALDPPPEAPVQLGVVLEPQPLAKQPNLFLGVEKLLTFLLYEHSAKNPAEEVDVPPEWLVLGLEADPRREVRIFSLHTPYRLL